MAHFQRTKLSTKLQIISFLLLIPAFDFMSAALTDKLGLNSLTNVPLFLGWFCLWVCMALRL
jgi:hypothetical protein